MDQLPPGAIPEDQFQVAQPQAAAPSQQVSGLPPGAIPEDQFQSQETKDESYSTPGHKIMAAVEGAGKGMLGPIAPAIEKYMLGVPSEDILAREKANPVTHGVAEAGSLLTGMLTGTGEAALMSKAGHLATEAAGLAKPISYAARVGSAAVQQAAEMAVLQGGDEIAKNILNDPDASAQGAIANIGLASALGAGGGALFTGAINPLWNHTIGPKLEGSLKGIVDHLNGGGNLVPKDLEEAAAKLGMEIAPEIKGANTSAKAAQAYNNLKKLDHPVIKAAEKDLHDTVSNRVMESTGKSTEELQNFDKSVAGREAMNTFKEEFKGKFEKSINAFEELTEPFQNSHIVPTHLSTLADKVAEIAQEKGYLGADIPQNKVVQAVLQRVPQVKTVADFSKLLTTVGNMAEGDFALSRVARDMKGLILDAQFNGLAYNIGKDAPELMEKFQMARAEYAKAAQVANRMGEELSIGRFGGPKSFISKLETKRSPEQFLSKLSPRGNGELGEFMVEHFPQTHAHIQENELKKILAPAVRAAKGDQPINVKTLQAAVSKLLSGEEGVARQLLPQELIERLAASEKVLGAIPEIKDSGTTGGIMAALKHMPESALGMIGLMSGHGMVGGAIGSVTGHLGQLLSRNVPDAIKLGMLRLAASEKPIQAPAFKAMVEFLHNSIKGQQNLIKATGNIFQSGAHVIARQDMPSEADREKLDKRLEQYQKNPEAVQQLASGHVGHYLPAHQASLMKGVTQQIAYLNQLKPHPQQLGPLDAPIEPSQAEIARYNRALDVATNPMVVLQHVKDGTVQISDLQDLKALYPQLYPQLAQKVSDAMISHKAEDGIIPYRTRMGLSLFLGQPIDSSMNPESILAAQPKPKMPPPPQPGPQAKGKGGGGGPKRSTSSLNKGPKMYQTPGQAADSDRSSRD